MSLQRRDMTVAVTGLNATDNPAPGVAVLRSLREAPDFRGRLVGLAYDSLDPGLYCDDLDMAAAFLVPWPSQGLEAMRDRLLRIHARIPLDVIIPTLDAEMPALIALEPDLRGRGIHLFTPTQAQFDLRSKAHLRELGLKTDLDVPETRALSDVRELEDVHREVPYPFWVKGVFYGATRVNTIDEAIAAFHGAVARWGLPVIVQRHYAGEEYDVVAVGDGEGGLVGAVPMRKMMLTDKGKGWAGVTVLDPALLEMARAFMRATRWRGPCELEVLRTPDGRSLLLEVNPRFPAWCHLATGAGQNLAWAVARLALGEHVPPMREFSAGTTFVRVALDRIGTIKRFQHIASTGELIFKDLLP